MPEAAPWMFRKLVGPMVTAQPETRILRGRVIADAETVYEDGFVRIEGGRIAAVGAAADLTETVEPSGLTYLPGLINSHVHLAWDGLHDLALQSLDDAPEISAYKSAANMLKSLASGITTLRDLGMNRSNLFAKQAVAQGIFPGPRLLVCGEAIVQTGGHTYWCCREASGPDDMRRAVREQVRGGADLIKIMACHDKLEFTDEELHAVIDETHRAGLKITAHATFDAAIARVVAAGIDCVEHGGAMSEATIALLLDRGVPIVTTFAPLLMQSVPEIARRYAIPEWKIEERQRMVADPARYAGLQAAAKAGVPILFGTDAGSPAVPHDTVVPELEFMVKLGLVEGNSGAIACATERPARHLGLQDQTGTLTPGKSADMIAVEGDPLTDLAALGRVQTTWVGGRRLFG